MEDDFSPRTDDGEDFCLLVDEITAQYFPSLFSSMVLEPYKIKKGLVCYFGRMKGKKQGKKIVKGGAYYKALGFDKVVVVPMKGELYDRLKLRADQEERTIQATARRILEETLKR